MDRGDFGKRLERLRLRAGVSLKELSGQLGVSEELIARWERNQENPEIGILRALADGLGVTVDELLETEYKEKRIQKIVVTGGPCGGKTTALSWIQNALAKRGYDVLFVDETATELITGGAAPWLNSSNRDFQLHLIELQMAKEKAYEDIARTMKKDKVFIVCDRGVMDNLAYMTDQEFSWVLKRLGTHPVDLRERYDAVIHLVSAAKGAEEFYTLSNNSARTETLEQAAALDDRLIAAWTGHSHLRIIDNSTGFEQKMHRLLKEIMVLLSEDEPMEIERKFLIRRPDPQLLEQLPGCERLDIVQIYLRTEQDEEEVRIRQRGANGHYTYYKTRKVRIDDIKRVEQEERISKEEYLTLMMLADPACRPIRKSRYCLSENGLYYEIDLYPDWEKEAIMEVELNSEDQAIVMPKEIQVIREVTGDPAYKNHALAMYGGGAGAH